MKDAIRLTALVALLTTSVIAPASVLAAGPPVNDDWANAPVITSLPYSDGIDTTEATNTGDVFNFCGGGEHTVWYRIESAVAARVEISTSGSDFDTVIDLYEWFDPPGAFAPRTCDDNGGPDGTSLLVADMPAGQTFAIMVSSRSGQPGGNLSLTLSVVPTPSNDDFDTATVVGALPFHQTIDIGSATSAADDPASTCGGQGPSVWYDFEAASAGRYAISTEGTTHDTLLTIYTGPRGALSEVACNDDYDPIGSYQGRLRFDAQAGTTYHVGVTLGTGLAPTPGILEFGVQPAPAPPVNDDFDDATALGPLPFGADLDTSEATTSPDDPAPSCFGPLPSIVWYTITPSTTERVHVEVRGNDFAPSISLYRGTRGALAEMACSAGGSTPGIDLDPEPGTTYHVLVGGATGDAGQLRIDAKLAFVAGLTISGGKVDPKSGIAILAGTITCNRPSLVFVDGELGQKVARHTVRGRVSAFVECDGSVPWTASATGDNGPFVPGKAAASLSVVGIVSGTGESSQSTVTKTLTLKAGRRGS